MSFVDKAISYVGTVIDSVAQYFRGETTLEYLGSAASRAGGAMSVPVSTGAAALNVDTATSMVNFKIRVNADNCWASGACNIDEYSQIRNDLSNRNYESAIKVLNQKGYQ